jgi:hypothetical protein
MAPRADRTTDPATGAPAMSGGNGTTTLVAAYDVIGELRGMVFGLQAWVRALIGEGGAIKSPPAGSGAARPSTAGDAPLSATGPAGGQNSGTSNPKGN